MGAEGIFRTLCGHPGEGYKTLFEGQVVGFDVIQGEKSPQASNVSKGSQE